MDCKAGSWEGAKSCYGSKQEGMTYSISHRVIGKDGLKVQGLHMEEG